MPVFWAIKVMHLDLMRNNIVALNNESVNRFYIPPAVANIRKFSVPIQSKKYVSILLVNS